MTLRKKRWHKLNDMMIIIMLYFMHSITDNIASMNNILEVLHCQVHGDCSIRVYLQVLHSYLCIYFLKRGSYEHPNPLAKSLNVTNP